MYYFRQILHNNNDEDCVRILQNQIPAMGPQSVIVIDDKTNPDARPPPGSPEMEYASSLNIAMKVMFNAQERKESEWRKLFAKTGLVIKEIRETSPNHDSIIIAVKA